MRSLGWALIQYDWCSHKERDIWTETHIKGRWCEDTGRRWPSTSQEAWEESNPLTPGSWIYKPLSLWDLAVAAQANLHTHQIINLPEPQFPQLQNGNTWPAHLTDLLEEQMRLDEGEVCKVRRVLQVMSGYLTSPSEWGLGVLGMEADKVMEMEIIGSQLERGVKSWNSILAIFCF